MFTVSMNRTTIVTTNTTYKTIHTIDFLCALTQEKARIMHKIYAITCPMALKALDRLLSRSKTRVKRSEIAMQPIPTKATSDNIKLKLKFLLCFCFIFLGSL